MLSDILQYYFMCQVVLYYLVITVTKHPQMKHKWIWQSIK